MLSLACEGSKRQWGHGWGSVRGRGAVAGVLTDPGSVGLLEFAQREWMFVHTGWAVPRENLPATLSDT